MYLSIMLQFASPASQILLCEGNDVVVAVGVAETIGSSCVGGVERTALLWFRHFDEHVEGEVDGNRLRFSSRSSPSCRCSDVLLFLWCSLVVWNRGRTEVAHGSGITSNKL
jgi:hypothetical protein